MQPNAKDYKNDFEKEFFMAINLFRDHPKRFANNIKNLKN